MKPDVRKGDKIKIELWNGEITGTVVRVLTNHVIFHCEGLGHPTGCEHRAHQTDLTITQRAPRRHLRVAGRPVVTTFVADRVARQLRANQRPIRQVPFNLQRWRDDPALIYVKIDGKVLLDKRSS